MLVVMFSCKNIDGRKNLCQRVADEKYSNIRGDAFLHAEYHFFVVPSLKRWSAKATDTEIEAATGFRLKHRDWGTDWAGDGICVLINTILLLF